MGGQSTPYVYDICTIQHNNNNKLQITLSFCILRIRIIVSKI